MPARIALVAAAAIAAAALGAPAQAAQAPSSGCADVQIVVARGTGEPGTVGSMGGLAGSVTSAAKGTVATYGLPYPASNDFMNSSAAGVSALAAHLTKQAKSCPGQRFVLFGYSQGAWVVGDVLAGGSISAATGRRIDAVVLWGDPRFRGSESFDRGSFKKSVNGVYARPAGALGTYAARIRSYCSQDDTVCQSGASGSGHMRYPSTVVPDASSFVVSKLSSASAPKATPKPTAKATPKATPSPRPSATPAPAPVASMPAVPVWLQWIVGWLVPRA